MQKFKVNGQPVQKIEWKQTDGRTEAIALLDLLMQLVKNQKFEAWLRCVRICLFDHVVTVPDLER